MNSEKGGNRVHELAFEPSTDPNILFRSSNRIAISRFASSC
jgi:hypothetical protein